MFRTLLAACALQLLAACAFAAKVFSPAQLQEFESVLVVPIEWKPAFNAVYQGVTVFGNREVKLAQDFETHACIARGVADIQPAHSRVRTEVLPRATVQAMQARIEKPGSSPRAYAKSLVQLVRTEHTADLYVVVLTAPHDLTSIDWGSHGFMGIKAVFSGKPAVRAFWFGYVTTWDASGRLLAPAMTVNNGAEFAKVANGDEFVRIVNEQSAALRKLLRAFIVRETRDRLGELLGGKKQYSSPKPKDLAPLDAC